LSDFNRLWHDGCGKTIIDAQNADRNHSLKYEREGQRYASDLTDAEGALIAPQMPAAKRLGRPRETELRNVLDAILCIARTGCRWRLLPKDFPPFTTVQGYFYDWRDDGVFEKINFALLLQARQAAGREPSPSAAVVDSQSVKTTESGEPRGGACPRARLSRDPGDAAKKAKACPGEGQGSQTSHCDRYLRSTGRCRGAPRDVRDRDGAVLVIEAVHQLFPWLRHLFADSVYNGPNLREALAKFGRWTIEIVKRAADAAGFQLLPRRFVVERTLASVQSCKPLTTISLTAADKGRIKELATTAPCKRRWGSPYRHCPPRWARYTPLRRPDTVVFRWVSHRNRP
jgi:transposase